MADKFQMTASGRPLIGAFGVMPLGIATRDIAVNPAPANILRNFAWASLSVSAFRA
jgi:hypothetical protein